MEKIVALLGCDCIVLVAGYYDIYRKPAIGSFRYLQSLFSSPIEAASFFCGDTYGTCCGPSSPLGKKPKKLTDILFAKNCGVPFYTPSDFFSSSSLLPTSPYPRTRLRPLLAPKRFQDGSASPPPSQRLLAGSGSSDRTARLGEESPVRRHLRGLRASESGRAEDAQQVPA